MRFIIVTGANKGIGYGIVKHLALDSKLPSKILLTSRDVKRGKDSLERVVSETKSNWHPDTSIEYHQLDITSESSVSDFSDFLSKQYGSQCIDILLNNAGYFDKKAALTGENVETTLNINFFGTYKFTEKMLPLMKPHSRIIIVSSAMGKTGNLPPKLRDLYNSPNLTFDDVISTQKEFIKYAYEGTCNENGYPTTQPYSFSKAGINAYTRFLASRVASDPRKIFVASCHPGHVRTDMGGSVAPISVDEGVKTPVFLANADWDEVYPNSGQFYDLCKVTNWK
ncbi:hypothetical protein BB560_002568 [Smittium megazygosporum]|uniref:Carbonyl reductase [NADPH] 1 n=1 Tax=Smittium megazygosporum TaxID=133381 RepID=A0A2T9ZEK4_9FUNG|nr:hypothetical protein BB560_002566 [Smittium megazygosporum]PVV02967.1 hypothetical protein BB560_002568 [Smittium megazygosporum]